MTNEMIKLFFVRNIYIEWSIERGIVGTSFLFDNMEDVIIRKSQSSQQNVEKNA